MVKKVSFAEKAECQTPSPNSSEFTIALEDVKGEFRSRIRETSSSKPYNNIEEELEKRADAAKYKIETAQKAGELFSKNPSTQNAEILVARGRSFTEDPASYHRIEADEGYKTLPTEEPKEKYSLEKRQSSFSFTKKEEPKPRTSFLSRISVCLFSRRQEEQEKQEDLDITHGRGR